MDVGQAAEEVMEEQLVIVIGANSIELPYRILTKNPNSVASSSENGTDKYKCKKAQKHF